MAKKSHSKLTKEKLADLSRRAKPRASPKKPKLWEPSDRDFQWYIDTRILGRTFAWMAQETGLSAPTICIKVKKVEEWLKNQHKPTVMEWRDVQTRELQHIKAECWRAWERSCGDAVTETTKETPTEAAKLEDGEEVLTALVERTRRTEKQVGDPRFIELILKVMRDIRDIWGVDRPTEVVVHTTPYDDLLPVGGKTRLQAKEDQLRAELAKVEARKREQEKGSVAS